MEVGDYKQSKENPEVDPHTGTSGHSPIIHGLSRQSEAIVFLQVSTKAGGLVDINVRLSKMSAVSAKGVN